MRLMAEATQAQSGATDLDLREYINLDLERRELKERLGVVEERLGDLEPRVLEYFERMGIDRVSIDGVTVYIRRELWAGREEGVSWEQACEALVAAGLEDYVSPRFNHMSLSAYVRELDRQGEPTPEPLVGIISIAEKFRVHTRKSG